MGFAYLPTGRLTVAEQMNSTFQEADRSSVAPVERARLKREKLQTVRILRHRGTSVISEYVFRTIDLIAAAVLIALLSPVLAMRAIIGKIAVGRFLSRSPRIGRNGVPFDCFLFAGDSQGRGLALLLNLVKGDITLTGPRPIPVSPAVPEHVDPICLSVKPGLVSPYDLRKKLNRDWETRQETEKDYAHSSKAIAAIGIATRMLLSSLLSGRSGGSSPANIDFFGISVRNTSMDEALDWAINRVQRGEKSQLAFVNPDCLNIAWENDEYRNVLKSADRILPDGIGIHLGCRILGTRLVSNLNGTDLFPRLCERAATNRIGIFLLGAKPGIAAKAATEIRKKHPKLQITGTMHGYFPQEQTGEVIEKINASGAGIVFVAMGAPQQELWLATHSDQLTVPLGIGVGGLFDFHSGNIQRAPVWVRELGMEWVWRLLMEPRRMWRRYVVGNPLFLLRVWRQSRAMAKPVDIAREPPTNRTLAMRKVSASCQRIGARTIVAARQAAKRTMDMVGSAIAMLLTAPVFFVTALAIKCESPGPILFRQLRVGIDGRLFTMFKFRSMYVDAEQRLDDVMSANEMSGGVIFKMKHDPRVTKIGRLLRKASIDELPQLWNVFHGDMSLVGPRPPLPSEVEQYSLNDRQRLHVRPGITCIWQVSGRSDIPFEKQVQLDIDYLHTQSLWTDIKLLLRTVPAVLFSKGAY